MWLATGLLHYQVFKGNETSQSVLAQLHLSEMVMQTTGFNQEDMQLSLLKSELNVVRSDRTFLIKQVETDQQLFLKPNSVSAELLTAFCL